MEIITGTKCSGKYIRLIQEMYRGCKTVVISAAGQSNIFGVEVGLHQGSVISQ